MSLNPRQYDVRELRSLAEAPRGTAGEAPRERPLRSPNRNRADATARSTAFTETLQHQRGLRRPADGERPYLTEVPTSPTAEHEIGEWLGYLVDAGGHDRSRDALSYYAELGWLTPDVADRLADRLPGFDAPRHDRPLSPADHRISLVSIVRLVSCTSDHQ